MNETLSQSSTVIADTPATRPRRQSGWILGAILAPMVAAYVVFRTGIGLPETTVNKGDLLLPATSVASLTLYGEAAQPLDWLTGDRRWRMVMVVADTCDAVCREQLYLSRQVHIRLGEKAVRVERLLLHSGEAMTAEFAAFLRAEHPRLKSYRVDTASWQQRFASTSIEGQSLDGHHIYYIDQEGYAMMSYGLQHSGADLLDDIKRLLKYSYEG